MRNYQKDTKGDFRTLQAQSIIDLPPTLTAEETIAFMIGMISGKIDAALIMGRRSRTTG
jgi:hypothetical protein